VSDQEATDLTKLEVDPASLYREEVFTDLHAATIRRLTPVRADGSDDGERPVMYIGETSLMTQMGPLPVQCPIEADSLEAACRKFPDAVNEAVDRLNERAKEMRREEASRIVVPSAVPPGAGGAGMPGAGGGGGGKIVLDK